MPLNREKLLNETSLLSGGDQLCKHHGALPLFYTILCLTQLRPAAVSIVPVSCEVSGVPILIQALSKSDCDFAVTVV